MIVLNSNPKESQLKEHVMQDLITERFKLRSLNERFDIFIGLQICIYASIFYTLGLMSVTV